MNFFLQTLKFKKYPVTEAFEYLKQVQAKSNEEFEEYSQKKRWEIFQWHYNNNPIYKKFVDAHTTQPITQWEQIPVLTKNDLQKPLEERLTQGINKDSVYIHNTSGSTGKPFFFAKDKMCHALTWAVIFDRYARHGIEYGKSKQARFYGIPLSFLKYRIERLKDKLTNRLRFTVYDLSDDVLEKYYNKFKTTRFEYINGYTSALVLFAKYLIKNNLVLKQVCPTLKVTFPTSEMCSAEDRALLQKGFGVKVANEYGAAELDIVAFEDEDLDWIINEENLYIEILDNNNNPVPNGSEGKIIITALHNKAMPFIRYELGDVGVLSATKKGKYRVLEKLIGRTNDVVHLPSGKTSAGLTFYYISKKLLESGGFMKEFVIRQKTLNTFHFEYCADREITTEEEKAVQKAMDTYFEEGLKVTFERKEKIERTKAGKLKHFFSEVKP